MLPARFPAQYLEDGFRLYFVEQFTPRYIVLEDCYTGETRCMELKEFAAMKLRKVGQRQRVPA